MANTLTDALMKKPTADAHSVVRTRFSTKMKNLSAADSKPVTKSKYQKIPVIK